MLPKFLSKWYSKAFRLEKKIDGEHFDRFWGRLTVSPKLEKKIIIKRSVSRYFIDPKANGKINNDADSLEHA